MSTATFEAVNEVRDAKTARKKRQAFYTPLALVDQLVEWADVYTGARTIEPSAGDGRIVHALRTAGVESVDACEIDEAMRERIVLAGGTLVAQDFLAYRPGAVYDRIVMNPPFAGRTVDRHLEHAFSLLRPSGRIVSIAPRGFGERLLNEELALPGCADATYEKLDGNWFKEYGTNIEVELVEICASPAVVRPVEGFANGPTYAAAVSMASDGDLYRRYSSGRGTVTARAARMHARAIIGEHGTMYGVDWHEVAEYLNENWNPQETVKPDKNDADRTNPTPGRLR